MKKTEKANGTDTGIPARQDSETAEDAEIENPEKSGVSEEGREPEDTPPAKDPDEKKSAGQSGEGDEDQLALIREKLLRTRADFENYRKRMQREFGEIRKHTKLLTIQEFLTVYDHFQMALEQDDSDLGSLKQGMELIRIEFKRTLGNLGVTASDSVGKPFDPNVHEAMAQEASEEVPEGHVLRQWKCGFRMGDSLLRPATVIVSSGPPADSDDD